MFEKKKMESQFT